MCAWIFYLSYSLGTLQSNKLPSLPLVQDLELKLGTAWLEGKGGWGWPGVAEWLLDRTNRTPTKCLLSGGPSLWQLPLSLIHCSRSCFSPVFELDIVGNAIQSGLWQWRERKVNVPLMSPPSHILAHSFFFLLSQRSCVESYVLVDELDKLNLLSLFWISWPDPVKPERQCNETPLQEQPDSLLLRAMQYAPLLSLSALCRQIQTELPPCSPANKSFICF